MTIPPEAAREALAELEFDRATGKLSEADYHDLRAPYLAALGAPAPRAPATTPAAAPPATDQAEALIASARRELQSCPEHGPRPEGDAAYCSACGRFLGPCRTCGARVDATGPRFCPACGATLRPSRT